MNCVVNHVSKTLRRSGVLNDVTLSFGSGTVSALVGINGSGKTMLLRAIAGFIKTSAGSISFDGKVLFKDIYFPPNAGVLIENPAFLESYTGFGNLKLLAGIRNIVDDEGIDFALSRVGLLEAKAKKYRAYSLGMKQRLGIAAAIMETPGLLLLDEPTNALDTDGVELLERTVHAERERGATVIMASHDQRAIEQWCDVVIHMEQGRVTGKDDLNIGRARECVIETVTEDSSRGALGCERGRL